jgi:hypothetical protein
MPRGEEKEEFYLRYYVGHKGKFGHEFLEFEFQPDGKMRYANNSNYKNDTMIRKEAYVSDAVTSELRRIVEDSEIMKVCPPHSTITALTVEIRHSLCLMLILVCFVYVKFTEFRKTTELGLYQIEWGGKSSRS